MKCAKEMFEELGYKNIRDNCNYIEYEKAIDFAHLVYTFYVGAHCFEKSVFVDKNFKEIAPIYPNEVKAINKQLEELGWLDE